MPALVFKVIFAICAAGTPPDECRSGAPGEQTIQGPEAASALQCQWIAGQFLAAEATSRGLDLSDKLVVTRCAQWAEGRASIAPYGVVSEPKFARINPD